MRQSITFKTELNEIVSLEEVAILFDNIALKYATSLASISLYPDFMNLKQKIIQTTAKQRNFELSTLLTKIVDRKEEINNKIQAVVKELGKNKNTLKNSKMLPSELEQTIYEQEQTIKAYKENLILLEKKEKKIMSGNYQKIKTIKTLPKIKSLKRQLEYMKNNILCISAQHDNCFKEYERQLENLINNTIITTKHIAPIRTKNELSKRFNGIFENIENISDNREEYEYYEEYNSLKNFYLHESNEFSFDDKLIHALLKNEDYTEEIGSINGLIIAAEYNIE